MKRSISAICSELESLYQSLVRREDDLWRIVDNGSTKDERDDATVKIAALQDAEAHVSDAISELKSNFKIRGLKK
jgi:hypothetical protein